MRSSRAAATSTGRHARRSPADPRSRQRAPYACLGGWDCRETRGANGMATPRAHAVGSTVNAPQRLADLPDFPEGHLVQAFQDLVILQLVRAFWPIAIVCRPEIPFDSPDSRQQLREPLLQLHFPCTLIRHDHTRRWSVEWHSGRRKSKTCARSPGIAKPLLREAAQPWPSGRSTGYVSGFFLAAQENPHRRGSIPNARVNSVHLTTSSTARSLPQFV
jgi:hypothetical protein